MLHDDYLCLVESGKQQMKEATRKFKRKTWKQRQLLSESGFVLRIAPPSLSRDRRIKMKKSTINQSIIASFKVYAMGGCLTPLFAVSVPMLNTIFYLLLFTVQLAEINLDVVEKG